MVLAVNITQEDAKKTENMLTSTIVLATIMKISKKSMFCRLCKAYFFIYVKFSENFCIFCSDFVDNIN